jgi:TPR repeat protein
MKCIKVFLAGLLLAASISAYADDASNVLYGKMEEIAQRGNSEAQYHLGMMLNNGIGVTKNPREAYEWFEKSADAGDPLAAYKVGCYLAGQFGVIPINLEKALKFKLIAAEAGYALAQHDVAIIYFQHKEPDKAIRWWHAAGSQGYSMSLYNLSVLFKEGKSVPADSMRAYSYFKLAQLSSRGSINSNAQSALNQLKKTMSPEELEKAELLVVNWKAQPTLLTTMAADGQKRAKMLVDGG